MQHIFSHVLYVCASHVQVSASELLSLPLCMRVLSHTNFETRDLPLSLTHTLAPSGNTGCLQK